MGGITDDDTAEEEDDNDKFDAGAKVEDDAGAGAGKNNVDEDNLLAVLGGRSSAVCNKRFPAIVEGSLSENGWCSAKASVRVSVREEPRVVSASRCLCSCKTIVVQHGNIG